MPKNYNTTDLSPETAFKRHVFHRDQFAHYLRWSFVLNRAKFGESFVDFGCGSGALLEVLYRNKYRPSLYLGIDIRQKTIEAARAKYSELKFPVAFRAADLCDPDFDIDAEDPDSEWTVRPDTREARPKHVCSFEVIEHVGKMRAAQFLENFAKCGDENSTFYLSTPNFDPKVGAAGNHTYDAGDGLGAQPQEWDYHALNNFIWAAGFEIVEAYGTFASKKDYYKSLSPEDTLLYERLKRYYDANLVSNIMAPILEDPSQARNAVRVLRLAR